MNITDAFECIFHNTDTPLKCSGRRGKVTCMDIKGLFSCSRGTCKRIKSPYNCDRRCVDIPTRNKNVILMNGDKVFLSQCSSVYDLKDQVEVWNEMDDKVLMLSCYLIRNSSSGIEAIDCVNGSLLEKDVLSDLTNFTYLSYLHYAVAKPDKKITPMEMDLTISNDSKLMINLEGCVNTLKDECRDFYRFYGKDGSDHNARARFPCFYAENMVDMVVARFDVKVTEEQFLFASVVPTVLFVISCLTLILCQKSVVVGDDAKMRFKGCGETEPTNPNANGQPNDGGGGDSVMAL